VTAIATLRIGTRGSALALAQAGIVRDALAASGVHATLEVVETDGDRRAPDTAWGEGAFVSAIEAALLAGRIDVAVHSAKDVPTDEDRQLTIAAILPRADPLDVIVLPAGRALTGLDDLPVGSRVGTDSPRRTAFLRAARPDLRMHPLHGNVDTRLRRLDDGETDALVLAAAGLARLGRSDRASLPLAPDLVPPAPGQGALAVQVRADDHRVFNLVRPLDHPATRRAVAAERAVLASAGGGCRAPLGVLGTVDGGILDLTAGYARDRGGVRVVARRRATDGDDAVLVASILDDLATTAAAQAAASDGPRVVVTRPAGQAASVMLALVDVGLVPLAVPAIAIEPVDDGMADAALARLASYDWVVVTSANAVPAVRAAAERTGISLAGAGSGEGPRWAVVGAATERVLAATGVRAAFRPDASNADAVVAGIPLMGGERVLFLHGDLAGDGLPIGLRGRGARVEAVVVYRTVEAPGASTAALAVAVAEHPDAVVFSSGSTVRGLATLAAGLDAADTVRSWPAICIGNSTASVAAEQGFTVAAVAPGQDPRGVAASARDIVCPEENR